VPCFVLLSKIIAVGISVAHHRKKLFQPGKSRDDDDVLMSVVYKELPAGYICSVQVDV